FLGQHGTLIARMSNEQVAAISDAGVRSLLEAARPRGKFDAKVALSECAPEIRQSLAKALLSDEYATDDDKVKIKLLDEILNVLSSPKARLQEMYRQHRSAVASGDHARVKELQERISAMTGEQSR